jgi:hypothetical protein
MADNRYTRAAAGFRKLGGTVRRVAARTAEREGKQFTKFRLIRNSRYRGARSYLQDVTQRATRASVDAAKRSAPNVARRARTVGAAANRIAGQTAYSAQRAGGAALRGFRGLSTTGRLGVGVGAAALLGAGAYAAYRHRQQRLAAPSRKAGGGGAAAG